MNHYFQIYLLFVSKFLICLCTRKEELANWQGNWFPSKPSDENDNVISHHDNHNIPMGINDPNCDNSENNLGVDFDPNNVIDKLMYTCVDDRHRYKPSFEIQPLIKKYLVPPAYVPLHKCMNESIIYDLPIPTYGSHRPNWAKYGEYTFVPIQRWLHNVEHGAIVMLYHPCANRDQIDKLKKLVKTCLYRHIITPSQRLEPNRPLALVAWGKSLEMSVVHSETVRNFIKEFALKGPEHTSKNGQYDKLLKEPAKVVSDENDIKICP